MIPTEEQASTILDLLKVDLGITAGAYDPRLTAMIRAAAVQIETEGITLNPEEIGDQQILVMYAAWMWRRRDTMEGMPRMLRYILNNRLFSEKV